MDPLFERGRWVIRSDGDLDRAALAAVAAEGGGRVQAWVSNPSPATDALASSLGLARTRDVHQVRRPLPVGEPSDLETRPFEVGRDEEAWLDVNNRAFAWHPEQGGWDLETLRAREAEPWFDPAGFLLHERDGRLAGFCWTKVHPGLVGEIFVIAVDPDFTEHGLGRALVLAGLDHLASVGMTVGMLYVDETNGPAQRLYAKLGFALDHVDRAYEGVIPPSEGVTPPG